MAAPSPAGDVTIVSPSSTFVPNTLTLKSGVLFFQIDVKLSVQYMSFSAHADAKGIMQLIRQVRSMYTVIFCCNNE